MAEAAGAVAGAAGPALVVLEAQVAREGDGGAAAAMPVVAPASACPTRCGHRWAMLALMP